MNLPLAASRAHRLDRLRERQRTDAGPGVTTDPGGKGSPAAHSSIRAGSTRADDLARVLGGHVVAADGGSIAVVETRTRLPADLAGLADLPDAIDPGRPIVCLDTETTGLGIAAGTVPFLVGLGRWQEDEFVVRQLLLPDHPDERAMLEVLERHIPQDASLVTYNGRGFDWPLVTSRYRLHGRPPPVHAAHLDLLGLARQVWRHRLPDARLASVEAGICGVRRHGDLPGALIPERYFDWLRTGHAAPLREVMEHNHQDVLSLALLLRVLAHDVLPGRTRAGGSGTVEPGDLAGLGRLYAKCGKTADALLCFELTLERMLPPGRDRDLESAVAADRARALGRLGRRAEAASAWEAVALDGGPMAPMAWIAVAKSREHVLRDPAGALTAARRADALAFRWRFLGLPQPIVERDLARRLPRLLRLVRAGRAARSPAPSSYAPPPGPQGVSLREHRPVTAAEVSSGGPGQP